jgi:hypothetical protein
MPMAMIATPSSCLPTPTGLDRAAKQASARRMLVRSSDETAVIVCEAQRLSFEGVVNGRLDSLE